MTTSAAPGGVRRALVGHAATGTNNWPLLRRRGLEGAEVGTMEQQSQKRSVEKVFCYWSGGEKEGGVSEES